MILLLKLAAIFCLGCISYQDFKERSVYWFLFPILAILMVCMHYLSTNSYILGLSILSNIFLVSLVLLILFLYTKLIQRKQFLDTSFGLGDLLFFYALSLSFPTLTFIIIFVFSIFFSLLCFLIFKKNMKYETVPLAGFQSLFLLFVLSYSTLFKSPYLYTL